MDIGKWTTRQKSVLLAQAVGWETAGGWVVWRSDGVVYEVDLYQEVNMALAWRVLNWAMTRQEWVIEKLSSGWVSDHVVWLFDEQLLALPPAEAQAALLDKILELGIEAGLVQP